MIDVNKLKGKRAERGENQQEVAKLIGIDRSTLYRKMKEDGSFTVGEASKMVEVIPLNDSETISIFLIRRARISDKNKKHKRNTNERISSERKFID